MNTAKQYTPAEAMRMALQHIRICAPDPIVDAALESALFAPVVFGVDLAAPGADRTVRQALTPSSLWSAKGEPDPHGATYDCERAALALGEYTDDELANAVFLHGNESPLMADVIAGKALLPGVYLTAAKDRIRWLSRKLSSIPTPKAGDMRRMEDGHWWTYKNGRWEIPVVIEDRSHEIQFNDGLDGDSATMADEARAYVAELDPSAAGDDWLPIESIPRNGDRVQLLAANGKTDFGNWYAFADWNAPSDDVTDHLNTDNGEGDYTHWRPLAAQEAGRG